MQTVAAVTHPFSMTTTCTSLTVPETHLQQ
jgi:hypothetical protein